MPFIRRFEYKFAMIEVVFSVTMNLLKKYSTCLWFSSECTAFFVGLLTFFKNLVLTTKTLTTDLHPNSCPIRLMEFEGLCWSNKICPTKPYLAILHFNKKHVILSLANYVLLWMYNKWQLSQSGVQSTSQQWKCMICWIFPILAYNEESLIFDVILVGKW